MRIVIVDDDTALLKSLDTMLYDQGCKVTTFSDSHEAYNFFKKGGTADILILDYFLTGVTGKRFLQLVRQYVPQMNQCKVIIVSGQIEEIDGVELKLLGAEALLPKPVDFEDLWRILNEDASVAHSTPKHTGPQA